MKSETRLQVVASVAALAMTMLTSYAVSQPNSNALAAPESFAAISDTEQRSVAMFTELGKVLTHPLCELPSARHIRARRVGHLHLPLRRAAWTVMVP